MLEKSQCNSASTECSCRARGDHVHSWTLPSAMEVVVNQALTGSGRISGGQSPVLKSCWVFPLALQDHPPARSSPCARCLLPFSTTDQAGARMHSINRNRWSMEGCVPSESSRLPPQRLSLGGPSPQTASWMRSRQAQPRV